MQSLPSDGEAISANISGQEGGGGGGGGVVATPIPSLNLNHCLSDLLLIVVLWIHPRSIRIQIKVVNICEMYGTGGLEFVVFDRFSDMYKL